jgi:hypothetical protein
MEMGEVKSGRKRVPYIGGKSILRCTRGVNKTTDDYCDAIFRLYNIGFMSLYNHRGKKHSFSPAPIVTIIN